MGSNPAVNDGGGFTFGSLAVDMSKTLRWP